MDKQKPFVWLSREHFVKSMKNCRIKARRTPNTRSSNGGAEEIWSEKSKKKIPILETLIGTALNRRLSSYLLIKPVA